MNVIAAPYQNADDVLRVPDHSPKIAAVNNVREKPAVAGTRCSQTARTHPAAKAATRVASQGLV